MSTNAVYMGNNKLEMGVKSVQGEIFSFDNDTFFKISNYNYMQPFFMNIVSDSDLWMFISSNGALSAGRKNPDCALFPYYTDDRIHDSRDITGSKTIIIVNKDNKSYLWEPFSSRYQGIYRTANNIYKNIAGNKLVFEEINYDLETSFRYTWSNCEKFGFVKTSRICNLSDNSQLYSVLDGILNILPYGVDRKFQLEYSTLLDAYKKSELLQETGLGIFTLSSIPTDRAEPSEALKATTVWSCGLDQPTILLSATQLNAFRQGGSVFQETDVRAERGAYLLQTEFELPAEKELEWYIAADLNNGPDQVAELEKLLKSGAGLIQQIKSEIALGTDRLKNLVARADGFQLSNDPLQTFRHFSNTLFNIMRGGIFDNNYMIDKKDFKAFIESTHKEFTQKHASFFQNMDDHFTDHDLMSKIRSFGDSAFEKLCYEYLPITFSRRHGDPSRPWNYFSIDIKDQQGNKVLNYQGNWRDIFQNWEALSCSFPNYIENMIIKFLNASTADGYNPYRVTRDGFDWEVLDKDDAWSYIGYWGDHQIVYLNRLLQVSDRYHPDMLESLLERDIFAYSNVPYRIKPYRDIVADPQNTIDFDYDLDRQINERVDQIGTDGKYVWDRNGQIYFVNLTEKLLVTLLVKLSNFIPEAGIWMNTQRPEWNDANNALVGYGASMVTLYYLRKFVLFFQDLCEKSKLEQTQISGPVVTLFNAINNGLVRYRELLNESMNDKDRKTVLDVLGQAGSEHRDAIYNRGFDGTKKSLSMSGIASFLNLVQDYIDHSITANKRPDHLFHAYNLIKFENDREISIRYLYEMLEGQVAVLSSGFLSVQDSVSLLAALKKSSLYRKDQSSYLLYPNRQLKRFVDKNIIPHELLDQSKLLNDLLQQNDKSIVFESIDGVCHFNGLFRNASVLKQALQSMKNGKTGIDAKEEQLVLSIYESVFDHQSFTGRSGTFFKYEGLGSIYWHMVSKLLLAVQETIYRTCETNSPDLLLQKLKTSYYEIKQGIGVHKSPDHYGAFPTDPYSHTPANSGVQQPGMTGQVKEDFISRLGELGIVVRYGKIAFNTLLLDHEEFITKSKVFEYYDLNGKRQTLMLNAGMLAFTFCQVPIIYIQADKERVIITQDDADIVIEGHEIDAEHSQLVFQRLDIIKKIQVLVTP